MCGHLLRAGYRVSAYNRSPEKLASVRELGAICLDSPAEVAGQSDVVFTMVGFPSDVREIYVGPFGILNQARPGMIAVDMTTSEPSLACELSEIGKSRKVSMLDAPVSGGDIGAREARLSIMVGGAKETYEACLPLFQIMGKTIVYQGEAGSGQHTKMVNQTLIATNMIGVCEALLYAYQSGLNVETVLQSVSSGAAGSWSLSQLAPRVCKGDFAPGFLVDHLVKDLGIVLNEAARMRLSLPGVALARQLYIALQAQGGSRMGTQALLLALAKLSHIDWKASAVK
jgi:3-hydroxyisobutyrate dehydrogenase